jgi:hypothetical protein
VALFLFSALLSRGLADVRAEGDDETLSIIASHGYAGLVCPLVSVSLSRLSRSRIAGAQELFNLFVFGRAVTNVFDGDRVLTDEVQGSADQMVLRGTPARAPIGLLTLYEHFKSLEVCAH